MSTCCVAVCQGYFGRHTTPRRNCTTIIACMREAASRGSKLALFPELSLSGYVTAPEDVQARCSTTTPDLIASVRRAAEEFGIAAVIGIFETSPGSVKAYNVSLAIAPDGSMTRYRKIHICPNEPGFEPGESFQGPVVADLGFVRLGLSVCYDNWFPETARMAFLAGAEMLHMPFYWPAEWEVCDDIPRMRVPRQQDVVLASRRHRMMKVLASRALDNGMYLVAVDQSNISDDVGDHLPGKSMVFDPYGEVVVETVGWCAETLHFDYDSDRVGEWRESEFFPGNHLRPDVYLRAYERFAGQIG